MTTSLGEARRAATRRLAEAGVETAALDARLLVAWATGMSATEILLADDRPLDAASVATLDASIGRRAEGAPVARIVGEREFWSLPFRLIPETLVPRPDSETLVAAALDWLRTEPRQAPTIVDLGTGSGCLLVALLHEYPAAFGLGTDMSEAALAQARSNAEANGVGGRAAFWRGSWGAALAAPLDLIVSNPPYIRSEDIAGLQAEVRLHDPALALDGGADGLVAYRQIAADATRLLAEGGRLFVEIGAGQGSDVARLFDLAGLASIQVFDDLAGRPRVVSGAKA